MDISTPEDMKTSTEINDINNSDRGITFPSTSRVREDPLLNELTGNFQVLETSEAGCIKCGRQFETGVQCSRDPQEKVDEQLGDLALNAQVKTHKLCHKCVIKAANYAVRHTEVIVRDGVGLDCVKQRCDRMFLACEMRQFLPPEVEAPFQDAIFEQSMKGFCRDNPHFHLVKCSNCGRGDIVDECHRFHECKQCNFFQCWICGRLATKAHEIRSCEEMNRAEQHPSAGFLRYNNQELRPPRFV